jgi:hypothetical protein
MMIVVPGQAFQKHRKARRTNLGVVVTHVNKGKVYPYGSERQGFFKKSLKDMALERLGLSGASSTGQALES